MKIWTHGNSVQVQSPGWDVHRTSSVGRIARTGEGGWCHFAIPTFIEDETSGTFYSAHLRFSTGDQGTIDAVEVWDGGSRVLRIAGLSLQGVNQEVEFAVPEDEGSIDIVECVDISVHVTFGLNAANAWVQFFSVGAHLTPN